MYRTLARVVALLVALTVLVRTPARNERGLSQSTENAILLTGAVVVAGIVVAAITSYVQAKLPR